MAIINTPEPSDPQRHRLSSAVPPAGGCWVHAPRQSPPCPGQGSPQPRPSSVETSRGLRAGQHEQQTCPCVSVGPCCLCLSLPPPSSQQQLLNLSASSSQAAQRTQLSVWRCHRFHNNTGLNGIRADTEKKAAEWTHIEHEKILRDLRHEHGCDHAKGASLCKLRHGWLPCHHVGSSSSFSFGCILPYFPSPLFKYRIDCLLSLCLQIRIILTEHILLP